MYDIRIEMVGSGIPRHRKLLARALQAHYVTGYSEKELDNGDATV